MSLLERIRHLFAGALGREQVGLEEGFFALGGDSLGAAAVIAGIEEHFGVRLQQRQLLERPTALGLGRLVLEERAASDGDGRFLDQVMAELSDADAERLLAWRS